MPKPKSSEYASKPGSKSEFYRKHYLRSHHWRKASQEQMRRAGYMCEYPGCGRPAKVVHHLNYSKLGHEGPEDLMALCNEHHEQMHRGWNVPIPANDNQLKLDFETPKQTKLESMAANDNKPIINFDKTG
jgi:hypothetical protein